MLYKDTQGSTQAQVGTRLDSVGDTIQTLQNSTASLAVDTGIGFVNLSPNTTLRIQSLKVSPGGGRLIRLAIPAGQARLEVRPLTNPESRIEIETPAGWSGVRGTEFGVAVRPDGSTGIATLEGSIVSNAQGESVAVNGGFQSLVIPGEPPLPPTPLTDNPSLNLEQLIIEGDSIHLSGNTDPINLLLMDDIPHIVERDGKFDIYVPLSEKRQVVVTVITPLGRRQIYEVSLF